MQTVSYLRVSTQRQGRSGLGLDAQRECIRRFAEANSIDIVGEFVEVETGKGFDALERRPRLAAALIEARRRGAAVLVAKLDRLGRNVAFISTMMEGRVRFFVAELGLDVPQFMLHIYAAVAEQELRMIGERTKLALAAAKARGVVLGSRDPAAASRVAADVRRNQADRFAANVVPLIWPLREQGLALRQIAAALDARGVATARGARWSATQVAAALRRAA